MVLFRTVAQSRAVEEAFLRRKLPYVMIGGTNFYERKEVKDLLGYLRVALGRDASGEGLSRCINAPFRFLGRVSARWRCMASWSSASATRCWHG